MGPRIISIPYIYGGTATDLPPLYFGSWISTDSQVPKATNHRIHRPTKATDPRVSGSHGSQTTESHRPPRATELLAHRKPPHTHMCWINLAYLRLAIWLTIGCLSHHPSRCSIHGSQACHLPPSHLSHRPIGLPATMCVLAHPLATKPPSNQTTNHQGHRSATYHPTRHQIHLLTGAKPPKATDHQVPGSWPPDPPDQLPPKHQGHMVTGLPLATLPPIIRCQGAKVPRCQGAKVPRCQSHHHQNIGSPDTISTDSPDHRSHRPTRLTGDPSTGHRATDPPLAT